MLLVHPQGFSVTAFHRVSVVIHCQEQATQKFGEGNIHTVGEGRFIILCPNT